MSRSQIERQILEKKQACVDSDNVWKLGLCIQLKRGKLAKGYGLWAKERSTVI